MVEGALFGSGRPVVVVPYIQKAGFKLDRVMVCWDASRNAARAIADAMPFLAKANAIDVVIVASDRPKSDEVAGADIGQHLARHGLTVEVKRIVATDTDVANTILSHAADSARRFHRDGRLRPLAPARIRSWRRNTRHPRRDDGAGADVALTAGAAARPHFGDAARTGLADASRRAAGRHARADARAAAARTPRSTRNLSRMSRLRTRGCAFSPRSASYPTRASTS